MVSADVKKPRPDVIDWVPLQAEAHDLSRQVDGSYHVGSGVRWGFNHAPALRDWTARFTDASIPEHVQDVYLVQEVFPPTLVAAHGMLAFEFDQDHPMHNAQGQSESTLAASWEPRFQAGLTFNVLGNGFTRTFPLHCQLESLRSRIDSAAGMGGHHLVKYKLNLTQEQKDQLLQNTLQDATHLDHTRYYNTLNSSCLTSAVHQLNQVLPKQRHLPEFIFPGVHHLMTALPTYADMVFRHRGLIDNSGGELIQADPVRFPKAQVHLGPVGRALETASEQPWFKPVVAAATVVPLALAGSVLGPLGTAVFGCEGYRLGTRLASLLKRRSHVHIEPYPG